MKKLKFLILIQSLLLCTGCISAATTDVNIKKPDSDTANTPTQEQTAANVQDTRDETKQDTPTVPAPSVKKLILTAMKPVGQTMYVWGGGWNEEDNGGGVESVTLGVSPAWKEFYDQQDSSYDYTQYNNLIHNGLDCSGFIGWTVYNTLETENGKESYVIHAADQPALLASRGLGTVVPFEEITEIKPGDIFNSSDHIYLLVDVFEDGSRLIIHAAPPGVQFSGTPATDGTVESTAANVAAQIMSTYYPDYYAKFPNTTVDASYNTFDQFTWNPDVLAGSQEIANLDTPQLMYYLFGKTEQPEQQEQQEQAE